MKDYYEYMPKISNENWHKPMTLDLVFGRQMKNKIREIEDSKFVNGNDWIEKVESNY